MVLVSMQKEQTILQGNIYPLNVLCLQKWVSLQKKRPKRGGVILAVRVRNIKQAYLYIKEQDSETALTESAFRRIVKGGLIPTFSIGSRILLKLDDVDKFLEGVTGIVVEKKQQGIRKQNVKG